MNLQKHLMIGAAMLMMCSIAEARFQSSWINLAAVNKSPSVVASGTRLAAGKGANDFYILGHHESLPVAANTTTKKLSHHSIRKVFAKVNKKPVAKIKMALNKNKKTKKVAVIG